MVHPILSNLRYLIFYSIFWLLCTLVGATLEMYNYRLEFVIAFVHSAIFNLTYAVLAIGLWYTVRYNNLETANAINRFLTHLIQAIVITGIWLLVCFLILKNIFSDNKVYLAILFQSFPIQFGIGIMYYSLSIMFYYLLLSYRNLQEKTRNEAELKALVKETELNLLKSQINPHFLFNSLNSISSLTITNPEKAQEMIIKLSEFLRHSIRQKNEHLVPLRDEIVHIQYYLDIEKIRFGDRLKYDLKSEDGCQDYMVPGMLLQPLFENAIKHGVHESTEEVTVTFVCESIPLGLKLTISNNFDPNALPRKGNKMGIKNIANRLKLLYQSDNLLKIYKSSNFFVVEITIPSRIQGSINKQWSIESGSI